MESNTPGRLGRRAFVARVGLAGVAAGCGAFSLPARAQAGEGKPQSTSALPVSPAYLKESDTVAHSLSRAAFAQCLGSAFRIGYTINEVSYTTDVVLAELEDGPAANAAQGYESFSLLFRGGEQPALPQNTYPFSHPKMGDFALFIVPISQKDGVRTYEAVFNRYIGS